MKINSFNWVSGDDTHTFVVRYPGAAARGTHTLLMACGTEGNQSNTEKVEIGTPVTNISPVEGSAAGGTEVTITGTHFSTTSGDMLVRLGTIDCPITSITATEIKCVTPASPVTDG